MRSVIQNIEANVYNPKTLVKNVHKMVVEASWNMMEHAQKTDCLSAKWTSPFKSAGPHFSLLLAAEVCASTVVMLYTPCSEVVWRVLATHSIRQFLLHFSSRASPCAITFQLESNNIIIHYRFTQLTSVYTDRELYPEQLIRRRRLNQELATFKLHTARSNYAQLLSLFPTFGLYRVCQYTECTEMRTILYSSTYHLHLCNLIDIKNHLTVKGLNKLVQRFLLKHDVTVPRIQEYLWYIWALFYTTIMVSCNQQTYDFCVTLFSSVIDWNGPCPTERGTA